jgi:hypothetical protein
LIPWYPVYLTDGCSWDTLGELHQSPSASGRCPLRVDHLKTHHDFERMRLRGLSGARDEFHLAAIVQNLKTVALRLLGPPPERAPA